MATTTSPVVLILGVGPGIGSAAARVFGEKGYRLALASRSLSNEQKNDNEAHFKLDLSEPEAIADIFRAVEATYNAAPSVVLYNGGSWYFADAKDPLANFDVSAFTKEFHINATSVGVALKLAVEGFRTLPQDQKKTFILTGNALPTTVVPHLTVFNATKTAGYKLVAGSQKGYAHEGGRFYFVDERSPEGGPVRQPNGPAHADVFMKLVESGQQEELFYSFVAGSVQWQDFGQPKNSD